ncbi:MAG: DUF368 domain-containing protein [Clostridia bacterium]|nr:DUF368 domain-containing protein [Clostridia bacterium]
MTETVNNTAEIRKIFKNSLCGLVIGSSMLVPGVSGGTTAIMLGIYDRLLSAVGNIFRDLKKNIFFLLEVAVGGILGVLLFSELVLWLVEKWHLPMMYFFIGAIVGSVPVLLKKSKITLKTSYNIIYALIGAVLVFAVGLLPKSRLSVVPNDFKGALLLILCGIIIAVALVLPGISTSHILLVLGMYEAVWGSFRNMNIYYIFLLGIGVILGTLLTAKITDKAMKRFPQQTFMAIIGFVLVSVFDIFPGVPNGIDIVFCTLMAALGFTAVFLASKFAE